MAYRARPASGSRWTRCATRTCSRSCGSRGTRAVEDAGDATPTRVLARQARAASPATPASRAAGWRSGCSALGAEVHGLRAGRRHEPSLFAAGARRRRLRRAPHRRRPRRRARRAARASAAQPRGRLPPRRAAAGAARATASRSTTFATNVMGTAQPARGGARRRRRARRSSSSRPTRCYENREWAVAVPRGRRARRPRSVQRQQGRRPSSSRRATATRSSPRAGRRGRDRARRQRHRRRRLGEDRLVPDCVRAWRRRRRRCAIRRPQRDPAVAARARAARRLPAARPSGCCADAGAVAEALELRPATRRGERSVARGRRRLARGMWPAARCDVGDARRSRTRPDCCALDSSKARAELGWRPRWDAGDDASSARSTGTGAWREAATCARCAAPTSTTTSPTRAGPACHERERSRALTRHAARRRCGSSQRQPHRRRARLPDAPVLRRRARATPAGAAPIAQVNHTLHARSAAPCAACTSSARRTPRSKLVTLPARRGLRRRRRPARAARRPSCAGTPRRCRPTTASRLLIPRGLRARLPDARPTTASCSTATRAAYAAARRGRRCTRSIRALGDRLAAAGRASCRRATRRMPLVGDGLRRESPL